ncbi:6320_t:CDS:2, partial [Acaulospora colombiana]
MNVALGLAVPSEDTGTSGENDDDNDEIPEVMRFPAKCSQCAASTDTKMHLINIPHFKEIVIMSTTCDVSYLQEYILVISSKLTLNQSCGYKSNEVKAGGPISPTGKRIILKMEDVDDLSRDILKSETCGLSIPEVDLELQSGTLGGRFTTVEGLLRQVYDELKEKIPFVSGDGVQNERKTAFENFMKKLDKVINGESFPVHLILDDPLSNSYLQNPYAPDPDPNMKIENYERSFEQNEFLGLNDMQSEEDQYSLRDTSVSGVLDHLEDEDEQIDASVQEHQPRLLIMGKRRSGKSSIHRVVFNRMAPNDTLYLESTHKIEKQNVVSFFDFQVWDFPGQLDYFDETFDSSTIFGEYGALIFVIDAQDDYIDAIMQLCQTVKQAYKVNPNLHFEVLIHKVDSLSDELKIEYQRDISQRVMDELADDDMEKITPGFYLTSIYDHSIFESFSKIVQKLVPQLSTLENLLNILCANSGIEKAFLFDIQSKIYIATDSSPVDMQSYEICSDMIDTVFDISELYG